MALLVDSNGDQIIFWRQRVGCSAHVERRVLVRGYMRPYTLTANFDSSATPVVVPGSSPVASPLSVPVNYDVCPSYGSCSSDSRCGWCSYSGTCSQGSSYGSYGYCPFGYWHYSTCPFEPIAEECTATSCVPRTSANSTCSNGHYTQASQCTAAGNISEADPE